MHDVYAAPLRAQPDDTPRTSLRVSRQPGRRGLLRAQALGSVAGAQDCSTPALSAPLAGKTAGKTGDSQSGRSIIQVHGACRTKLPAITRPSADELAGAALPHLRPRRVAERSASSASSTALASPRSPGAMQLQAATRPSSGEYTPQSQSQPQCPSATQLMLQRNGPRGDGSQQLFVRPGGAWHAAVGQHGASSASVPGNGPSCYSNLRCASYAPFAT